MKFAVLLLSIFVPYTLIGQALPCIASVHRLQFVNDHLRTPTVPAQVKQLLPRHSKVQFVVPLSNSSILTIYGTADSDDPNTRLLVTSKNTVLSSFAIADIDHDHEWARSLTTFGVAHFCSNGHDLTYLVLQTGNQGGYIAALRNDSGIFQLIPIRAVQQGRIIVNSDNPSQFEIWSVAPEDGSDCTACRKHYVVEALQLDGTSLKVIAKKRTRTKYASFQDEALVLTRKP